MKALGFFLLGILVGVVALVAGVLGVFGQGEGRGPSNTIDDSDTDR